MLIKAHQNVNPQVDRVLVLMPAIGSRFSGLRILTTLLHDLQSGHYSAAAIALVVEDLPVEDLPQWLFSG